MTDEMLAQRIVDINAAQTPVEDAHTDREKRTYSVNDIQNILDISRSTAYQLIRRKLFKSVKAGKQIRISKKSFDQWLDSA